jgi:hypothetical protein
MTPTEIARRLSPAQADAVRTRTAHCREWPELIELGLLHDSGHHMRFTELAREVRAILTAQEQSK